MVKIETGVDRLVDLIALEKRVSVDDAAKKLGISKVVIQEWANFLEEEKVISIEYQLSKTFLVERKLSEVEIKAKEKEFSSEKDAFVRKVETSLKNLDKESVGLEKIKSEFAIIKQSIGSEVDKVKKEVGELEKYQYLKNNLDKEIEKQIAEFHDIIEKSHKEVSTQEKKHQEVLEQLEIEKREVQVKEKRLLTLEEKEKEIMDRLQNIYALARELEKNVSVEKAAIAGTENRVFELERTAKEIESQIIKKRAEVQPLMEKSKQHEEQIMKLQDDILTKTREKSNSIKAKADEGNKVVANFQKFFAQRSDVENLIAQIEQEKKELQAAYAALQKKALVVDLAKKSSSVSQYVKQFEDDYNKVTQKKSKFKEDLEKLIKLVKG